MLTKRQIADRLAVHPNTVDNLRRFDPTFPRPHRISQRTLRWDEASIERWLAARVGGPTTDDATVRANAAKDAAERLGL